jgi:hypothetical protein
MKKLFPQVVKTEQPKPEVVVACCKISCCK